MKTTRRTDRSRMQQSWGSWYTCRERNHYCYYTQWKVLIYLWQSRPNFKKKCPWSIFYWIALQNIPCSHQSPNIPHPRLTSFSLCLSPPPPCWHRVFLSMEYWLSQNGLCISLAPNQRAFRLGYKGMCHHTQLLSSLNSVFSFLCCFYDWSTGLQFYCPSSPQRLPLSHIPCI